MSEYPLLRDLPDTLEKSLPSPSDIEAQLARGVEALQDSDGTDLLGG